MISTAEQLMQDINKLLGAGTIKMACDESLVVRHLPTGVLPIDILLDGGIPTGRFTELFGAYSTLKSYVALSCIAQTQKAGGVCALIDTEHSYDPIWAKEIGVDIDKLIYQSPSTGEEAMDVSELLIRNGVDLIVWDSVAATLPQAESKKRMANESVQPARLAALMSLGMRKLTAANKHTAMLFINQTRLSGKLKEAVDTYDSEGKKVSINSVTGHKIKATLEKSKLSAPNKDVLFTFDLSTGGIDELGYIISICLERGMICHEGRSWWIANQEDQKIVGVEKFRAWMGENPLVVETLRNSLINPTGSLVQDKKKVVKVKK